MNHLISAKTGSLLVLIVAFCADEAWARKWTDSTGNFSIDAEFVEFVEGRVALRTSDGRLIRLPLERLSTTDQQHVRSLSVLTPPARGSAQAAKPSSGDSATQTVIAEGVGTTPDEALRDALRAAVNQVVGTVVDAETLVRNDELIEDKILMYSNAFVKQYERIWERDQGGLIRVRISATVERRGLIAKLKAENIVIKDVDGPSLFAEAITKVEEEKGAEALLRKALEGFPGNCLKAEIVGKPKLITQSEETATIRISVRIRADEPSWNVFRLSLQEILEKINREKGNFAVTARSWRNRPEDPVRFSVDTQHKGVYSLMPKVFKPSPTGVMHPDKLIVVALNTTSSKLADRTTWFYYALDEALRNSFLDVAQQQAQCTITLLNSNEEPVLIDQFQLNPGNWDSNMNTVHTGVSVTLLAVPLCLTERHIAWARQRVKFFLVSPLFFSDMVFGFTYVPDITFERDIELALDDMRSTKSMECSLTFFPSTWK